MPQRDVETALTEREGEEFSLIHRLTKLREEEEMKRLEAERSRAESEERQAKSEESDIKSALAALTSITVMGSEPVGSVKQYQTSPFQLVQDENITTTIITTIVEINVYARKLCNVSVTIWK